MLFNYPIFMEICEACNGQKRLCEYDCSRRKVEIDGEFLDFPFFPKKHNTVNGILVTQKDMNAGDSYANFKRYDNVLYIKWKGESDWKRYDNENTQEGPFRIQLTHPVQSISDLLSTLDDEDLRDKLVADRNEKKAKRIEHLEQTKKNSSAELKRLTRGSRISAR